MINIAATRRPQTVLKGRLDILILIIRCNLSENDECGGRPEGVKLHTSLSYCVGGSSIAAGIYLLKLATSELLSRSILRTFLHS